VHVMACESNFDPEARNRHSSATGAWQWLRRDWAWYTADVMGEQMHLDLRRNLESATRVTAHRVNREGGFGAWSCRRWTP
jgi:hypothetical protein